MSSTTQAGNRCFLTKITGISYCLILGKSHSWSWSTSWQYRKKRCYSLINHASRKSHVFVLLNTAISCPIRICTKWQIYFVEVLTLPSDLIDGSLFICMLRIAKDYGMDLVNQHCRISYREVLGMSPSIMGLTTQDHIFKKSTPSFTKSSSFGLIGPISNKIQPFKNFKI